MDFCFYGNLKKIKSLFFEKTIRAIAIATGITSKSEIGGLRIDTIGAIESDAM